MNYRISSSPMIILSVNIAFMIIMYGETKSQSLDCITTSSTMLEPSGITARCPEDRSTVSCGYRLQPENTTMDFGVFAEIGLIECVVPTFDASVTSIAYARCCNLATFDVSCSDEFAGIADVMAVPPRFIDDTIQTIGCGADSQLFGCSQSGLLFPQRRRLFEEVGILGTYPLNSTEPPPQGIFDLDNICTSHRTSSIDHGIGQNIGRDAYCCNTGMPDIFSVECIGVSSGQVFWDGNPILTLQCPDEYTMTDCDGYSPFNLVNGVFFEDGDDGMDQCVVQRINDMNDTHYSVATAICCQINTASPTVSPTEMTMNPTDDSSEEEEEGESNSNSESIEDALRINENLDTSHVDAQDKNEESHTNETVVIKLHSSLQALLWLILLVCMMTIFCWCSMLKSAETNSDNYQ